MPDLEKQIADWRRGMRETSKHRPEALDELEAHLREEIERLVRGGTSSEEAFALAVSKLGAPAAVGAEFHKLEEMRRAKWTPATLAQWACIGVAVLSAALVLWRIDQGRTTLLLASHTLTITIGYVMMFIIGGLAICYVSAELVQAPSARRRYALGRAGAQLGAVSAALTAIGIVLGMIWAKEHWGRYWAWDPKETGGVVVLICAGGMAALRWSRAARHNAIVVTGIVGSICTAVAWFGVNASMRFHPLVIVFIAGHCVALLAFAANWTRQRQLLS